MESFYTRKVISTEKRHASYKYVVFSLIFLSIMVLALAAISGYMWYQLNELQNQVNKANKVKSPDRKEVLWRSERSVNRTAKRPDAGDKVSSVTFVHWGQRTCPPRSFTLFDGIEGTVAGFHGQDNNMVAGSDIFCVTNTDSITHQQPAVSTGLKLQPVEFNLYGHSYHFRYRNKKGHLYCTHCFAEATDVITQIGRSCKSPEWLLLYKGFITTSYSSLGTSQSICVSSNAQPVSNNLFFSNLRSMSPAMYGSVAPTNRHANRRIPCYVCYRQPAESLGYIQGWVGHYNGIGNGNRNERNNATDRIPNVTPNGNNGNRVTNGNGNIDGNGNIWDSACTGVWCNF